MKKISEIAESINHIRQDIRAEVVVADYLEKGLNPDDFIVFPSGTFKRGFSTDIKKAEVLRLNNIQKLLGIHINRDSIYDTVPEGFFHSAPDKPYRGSDEMSEESKKMRKEEKEARNFFVPFENDIFLQRVALELQERKIHERFSDSVFDEIYPEFWNFDRTVDSVLVSKMILILHLAYQVAGNPEKTAMCLETILNENVFCKVISSLQITREENKKEQLSLGAARLGMDFVCGNSFDDLLPAMEFIIGPIKNSGIGDYLESGRISGFLDIFYAYFVPMGIDVSTRVLMDPSELHFMLDESHGAPVLGFNSAI